MPTDSETIQLDDTAPESKIHIVSQFIRDLSFEAPNILKLLDGPGENPNLNLEVAVSASQVRDGLFESLIDLKAKAISSDGVIYDLELIYGGLFLPKFDEDNPEATENIETTVMVDFPALLFPFVRRLVADITREGGFPPLLLDPIDFAALYESRKQQNPNHGFLN